VQGAKCNQVALCTFRFKQYTLIFSCIFRQIADKFSIDYIISAWNSLSKGKVTEQRDSITIDNVKATRIILKSDTPEASYRQLIYLKKYSTLFEIMNVNEVTEKDFEAFCESINIERYKKP
jgi:hypothetical protein